MRGDTLIAEERERVDMLGIPPKVSDFSAEENGDSSWGRKIGKRIGKSAEKAAVSFLKHLIRLAVAMGWWALALIIAIIFLGSVFNFLKDERGVSGQQDLNYLYENPTMVGEGGLQYAIALTEPQALIDAYYKYMACDSHQKYYDGKFYRFSDSAQTEDFAGLQDYYGREDYFYLSSAFIKMADELIHGGQFYYPEQIIKPVNFKLSNEGYVTAVPIYDTETRELTAHSKQWNEDGKTQTDVDEAGIWDYGLGSLLQYEAFEKDQYISCTYNSVEIDLHSISWNKTSNGWESTDTCLGKKAISIPSGATAAQVQALIDAYNETPTEAGGNAYQYVKAQPGSEKIALLTNSTYNSRIPQKVESIDQSIASRDFTDSKLASFSNKDNNGYYPINIPLITAAATMSGNIRYEYDTAAESMVRLNDAEGSDMEDNATDIIVGTGCERVGNLIAVRSGDIHMVVPSATEITEPWGFEYLDAYADNYVAYVPEGVLEDLDFSNRIEDGGLFDILKQLGLLKEYTGGAQAAVTTTNLNDVQTVAKLIACEAGANKLDELLVGAVLVNRWKDEQGRFGSTLIEVISQGNGKQYSTWASGAFQNATPTQRDYESAQQVLSGEFTIPKNVLFQSQKALGKLWLRNENVGPGNPHYYCWPKAEELATTDWAGNPAKKPSEIVAWAQSLDGIGKEGNPVITPMIDTGDTTPQIFPEQINSDYKLYAVRNFDVQTAIGAMQKAVDKNSNWLATALGDAFDAMLGQVTNFFNAMDRLFPSNSVLDTKRLRVARNISNQDAHDIVYQAVTFTNRVSYSEAADTLEHAENLMFLFVGKEGTIGIGTLGNELTFTPGIGSTLENYTSPTESYYQTTAPFTASHPYIMIAVPKGTVIQSVAGGQVSAVSTEAAGAEYGIGAEVTYREGDKVYKAVYGRLSEVSVRQGASVQKGQQIGVAGEDGFYFAFYVDGVPVNPLDYFYQPTWNTGVPFADLLDENGNVDEGKIQVLREALKSANNQSTKTYDKWHSRPVNTGYTWECPWYAWGRGAQYLESNGYPIASLPRSFGHGGQYYKNTAQHFKRGTAPRANSWVCWVDTTGGYGHVAYVEAVEKDGTFWISESWNGCGYPRVRHITKSNWTYKAHYRLEGFIYLDQPLR